MDQDVVVLGAGVAGLSCARALLAQGRSPVVIDRSTGPGGRLASRELEGQAFDYGVLFLNSTQPDFLDWVTRLAGGSLVPGWPFHLEGTPSPCQPGSLDPHQTRLAVRGGLGQLARAEAADLNAQGVTFQWSREAVALRPHPRGVEVQFAQGGTLVAAHVVLALAAPQSATLLSTLGEHPVGRALGGVLELFPTLPCLTVSALYANTVPSPAWDIAYPENSGILHLASNQGSLHHPGQSPLVVWQARPAWSARHTDGDRTTWTQAILHEAANHFGAWAATPTQFRAHRWKYARLDGTGTAGRPLVMPLGGGSIGLTGELFSREGGVEGAWRSGTQMAELFLQNRRSL